MTYSNSWSNSTPANPCTVTIAPNAGDIIIAWAITDTVNDADLDTNPSGYSLISRQTSTNDNAVLQVVYKVADGTETTVSFPDTSTSNPHIAGAITFSGRDTTTPLDVTPGTYNASTAGTTADISLTPVTDGCDLCFIYGNDCANVNSTFAFSTTSGTTEAWNTRVDQNSGFYNIGVGSSEQVSAGAITCRGTVSDTGGRLTVLIALRPAALGGQSAYPTSDITDGAWSPSTGSDLYATLDETSASDTDYDYTNSNSTMRVALGTLSTPASGTRTLKYRIQGSAAKKAIARLIEGSTTVQTFTDDPTPEVLTTKSQTVTGSISDYSNLRFELEIADATTTPSPSVSFGAIGTGANGSTTVAPSFPASISAGDLLVLVVSSGATNDETPSTPSNWTSQGSYATTDGTFGVDTGPRRITVFTKEATGSETGTQSVSITNGNTCRGTISRFAKTYPSYTWDIAATGGNYSSDGTSVSVTGDSISFAPGDAMLVANCQRVDSVTQSSQSLTASGITFGTRTNRASTAVTTGNDHRHVVDTFAAITSGTATTAPTWSYTASANCSAAILFLRLREVPPTEFGRVTWVMLNVPESASSSYNHTATGGATAGGTATLARTRVPALSGGLTSGGGAGLARSFAVLATSGLTSGGAATTAQSSLFTQTASGGLTSGGAALLSRSLDYASSGGLTSGGAAAFARTQLHAISGGLTSGGAATTSLVTVGIYSHTATGGLTTGGTATLARTRVPALSGGLTASGMIAVSRTWALAATGGLTGGGAATTALTALFTQAASGGLTSGGGAGLARSFAVLATSGLTSGGAATTAQSSLFTQTASGGLTSGGAALLSRSLDYASSGGLTSGGTVVLVRAWTIAATGGLTSGGAATTARTLIHAVSGGLTSGGAATISLVSAGIYSHAATGGLTSGGVATTARTLIHAVSGGLTAGGMMTVSRAWALAATGGLTGGGAATLARTLAEVASGGLTASGAANLARTLIVALSGGMTTGGAATVSLISAGIYSHTATGGATAGGTAILTRTRAIAGSGGLTFGGIASLVRTWTRASAGGLASGGAATTAKTALFAQIASGGAILGGSAILSKVVSYLATGGLTFGGAAEITHVGAIVYSHTASGGLSLAGVAALARRWVRIATGGILFSGAATVSTSVNTYLTPIGRSFTVLPESRQFTIIPESRQFMVT